MSTWNDVRRQVAFLTEHLAAIVIGFLLMIAGLGMGVTIVLLPLGIPVGIVGLFVFLWGLFVYDSR